MNFEKGLVISNLRSIYSSGSAATAISSSIIIINITIPNSFKDIRV